MPCERIRSRDGSVVGFVCSRGPRTPPKPCSVCGREATRLCDFKQRRGTCDAPLCDDCTDPRLSLDGEDASEWDHFDLCPKHSAESSQPKRSEYSQLDLGLDGGGDDAKGS